MTFGKHRNILIIVVLLTTAILGGCIAARNESDNSDYSKPNENVSEISEISISNSSEDETSYVIDFHQDENFEEGDIYAQMFNDYFYPLPFMVFYRFIYKTDDATYVTKYSEENQCYGIYCYTNDGEKSYIADNGWCCYLHDDVLYYLEAYKYEEDGYLKESWNYMSYQNGEKAVVNVDFFSNAGIYYSLDNILYKSSYDGNNNVQIYKPADGHISSSLEYDNYLWIFTYDENFNFTLHKLLLDGTEVVSIPMTTNEIEVRNHYFYFHDYNARSGPGKFFRYSIKTGEVEELPYINEYMEPVYFTDEYCFFEKYDGWLYRADKNFENIEKIININNADAINTLDNYIYVLEIYDGGVKQYDTDGNLIRTFD